MRHFTINEWQLYVENELPQDDREQAEDHLYSCDHCLDLYLQAVAQCESVLMDLQHMEDMTDLVMDQIQQINLVGNEQQVQRLEREKKPIKFSPPKSKVVPFFQTTFFHYTLAAIATIVLMMSGVFQNISTYTESVQSSSIHKKAPSVTEGIVNKTFSWLDSFESDYKEAKNK
jgi:anti-sigma factor RsiW